LHDVAGMQSFVTIDEEIPTNLKFNLVEADIGFYTLNIIYTSDYEGLDPIIKTKLHQVTICGYTSVDCSALS
jgi:hypothetical protein